MRRKEILFCLSIDIGEVSGFARGVRVGWQILAYTFILAKDQIAFVRWLVREIVKS